MDRQGIVDERRKKSGTRYMFLRRLRILASVLCLIICVVLLAFWLRSYHAVAALQGRLSTGSCLRIAFLQGNVEFHLQGLFVPETHFQYTGVVDTGIDWKCHTLTVSRQLELLNGAGLSPTTFGFRARILPGSWGVAAPYWFRMLSICPLAVLLKPEPRLRVGLRDLFIIVTLVALIRGAFEALAVDVS